MKGRWLKDQRGSAFLFATGMLAFLLIIGGIAIDVAYVSAVKGELQRSMDAAALAGAGKLGFDASVFPAARQEAWRYANLNAYHTPLGGTINLDLNSGNASTGDIVLGVWKGGGFTPSLDGSMVNAVRCRYATRIPTSFLQILGLNTLPVSAQSIAIANPPLTAPPNSCVFPIGLTQCPFQNAGSFNSQGCGAPITFISSSGATPGTTAGTNTGAWVNLNGTGTPSAAATKAALDGANAGACGGSSLVVGALVGASNGMQQSVFDGLETYFAGKYSTSGIVTITNAITGVTYTGKGWEVVVPVIQSDCPPQAITGDRTIQGWTRFVITQVINKGVCVVSNPVDSNSWPLCPPPLNPTGPAKDPNLRAVFGYYECRSWTASPAREPGPRSALGTRLSLVR